MADNRSLFQSRYWRIQTALCDATLIVLGMWWVVSNTMPWMPTWIFSVLAFIVWTGQFLTKVSND